MNKPQKHINRFAFIFMAVGFCQIAILSAHAKEPVYGGRSLSDWLCCEPPSESQQNAVRQMGVNAIPTLLDILGATEKTVKKVAARLDNKMIQRDASSEDFRIDDLQGQAVKGFEILGTNAESAIPQMVKLLNNKETTFYAAQALAVVGPKGFAALTNSLATSPMRGSIVVALGQKGGGDPKVVTQLLVNALKDEDPGIRANAADFLRDRDPGLAIPALIQALDDKEPATRQWAISALGTYGPAAKSVAPKILSFYTNAPDVFVLEALRKIDPETAGKAEEFLINSSPLNAAHIGYTKTLLKNGKELIAGGWISASIINFTNRCLSKSELLNPVTGKWVETGEMNVAREGHTAILLKNGQVLVAGGADGRHDLSSAELYDPTTGKWTMTSLMNKTHSTHEAILRPDGQVLVFSARYSGLIFDVEQYDPNTEKWTMITNLNRIPK